MRRGVAAALLAAGLAPVLAHAAEDGRTEAVKPAADVHPLKELWSGVHYVSEEIRRLQDSETDNPAMKLYRKGGELWSKTEGERGRSCETCHRDAARTMKGAAAVYPVYYKLSKKPVTIPERINLCREKFMGAPAFDPESEPLMALTVYVKRQSKGVEINAGDNDALEPFLDKGREYHAAKRGQLGISCSQCHDAYAGRKYRATTLNQGHPNGFPAYRKSWEETGSLRRQVNQCLARMRATPLEPGSETLTNLELYLMWRASGLPVETPAVRE